MKNAGSFILTAGKILAVIFLGGVLLRIAASLGGGPAVFLGLSPDYPEQWVAEVFGGGMVAAVITFIFLMISSIWRGRAAFRSRNFYPPYLVVTGLFALLAYAGSSA